VQFGGRGWLWMSGLAMNVNWKDMVFHLLWAERWSEWRLVWMLLQYGEKPG